MRVLSLLRSNRRPMAMWLLALAAVSPAAAGPVELSVASPQRPATQLVTIGTDLPKATFTKPETVRRSATVKRDPKLNDDLAAFSRAF